MKGNASRFLKVQENGTRLWP